LQNPSSRGLRRVNWAHDPVSPRFSLLVRCRDQAFFMLVEDRAAIDRKSNPSNFAKRPDSEDPQEFQSGSYGYRPKRTAHQAVQRVAQAIVESKTRIIDTDLRAYLHLQSHSTV
jgi:hypothetical protein